MKNIILFFAFIVLNYNSANGQCLPGEDQVIVSITTDTYPEETSWTLKSINGSLIVSGDSLGDTVCVPGGSCLIFEIRDSYGDGICCNYGQGSYSVSLNGAVVASGGQFSTHEISYLNCPPGSNCGGAFPVVQDTVYTATGNSTWYSFVPPVNGIYNISTCFPANTCDTRIWVYDKCNGLIWNNDMAGTIYYNDSACVQQAFVAAMFKGGSTYYIRIGGDSTCVSSNINWQITYTGPVVGCTDPAACNYNPLATVTNNNCIYPGDPNCSSGPDLTVDEPTLRTSLTLGTVNGSDGCLVGEGCIAGYGLRDIINFSTRIANIGDADYYIGQPDSANNQFIFDQCHGHWHYVGYAMYSLYDSLNRPMQGGFKNGFCVMDLQCPGGMAKYSCLDMGISAQCADIYASGLPCQWIDITDVPAGRYTLVVRVNWDKSPDKIGRVEQRFDNNLASVCIEIFRDSANVPSFAVLPNCQPVVDCAGDIFGLALPDCMGDCNGTRVSGDLNVDSLRDLTDIDLYMADITAQDSVMPCNDVNGDGRLTVTDAALVNGCIRYSDSTHAHASGIQITHRHCEFPFNIVNINDSVHLGIAQVNQIDKYIDLDLRNPDCRLLAIDFSMSGLSIDSVVSLVTGFVPYIVWNTDSGRIAVLDTAEVTIPKQNAPTAFLRVYYSSINASTICIDAIHSVVNDNYEETLKSIFNGCMTFAGYDFLYRSNKITLVPNPTAGSFRICSESLNGAEAEISISDALGRTVFRRLDVMDAAGTRPIDLGSLSVGMYLVRVKAGGLEFTERLMRR